MSPPNAPIIHPTGQKETGVVLLGCVGCNSVSGLPAAAHACLAASSLTTAAGEPSSTQHYRPKPREYRDQRQPREYHDQRHDYYNEPPTTKKTMMRGRMRVTEATATTRSPIIQQSLMATALPTGGRQLPLRTSASATPSKVACPHHHL